MGVLLLHPLISLKLHPTGVVNLDGKERYFSPI